MPQLGCAVIGCKSAEEVRLAARVVRDDRALSEAGQASVLALGKNLAAKWGARYPEG